MPMKAKSAVDEKIEELGKIDLDSVELKELSEFETEQKEKKNKKKNKAEKVDPKERLTAEQKEIVKLKSELMQEKIKNVGGKNKAKNFIEKKKKRTFRDTSADSNATTQSILKGAGLMAFVFGMLALIILLIRH